MKLQKKQKLIILISGFLIITGAVYLLYCLNQPRKLNVILITVDALRADHLGCYGYKRNTSPNIDKLAKEGVLFTQAIAQSSHTPASIGSIATSTPPNANLLINWGDSIKPTLSTMVYILKSSGYKTIFIGANGNFLEGLHRFTQDFDIFYEEPSPAVIITNNALQYLRKYINEPFFMWVHYMDVHNYAPSKPFESLYVNDSLYNKQNKLPIVKNILNSYGYNGIPESLARERNWIDNPDYYIALYDGAIRTIDEQVGILLEKLKQLHIEEKTLIIFTADHGEMLGERGFYFHHGWFLYEPLIKIPLLIKCNKIISKNKVIETQINAHLDIAPTILDILRIDRVKTFQGRSLLGIILGRNKYYSKYVFSDEGHIAKCIRTGDWKLIYSNYRDKKGYELYNLKDDPKELNNLVLIEKEKFVLLKQKLDEYKWATLKNKITDSSLDKETKERLQALGYLQ